MQTVEVRVSKDGRLYLPTFVCQALDVQGGAKLILTLDGDQVRLTPVKDGITRARALYRRTAISTRSTDDFLGERNIEGDRP